MKLLRNFIILFFASGFLFSCVNEDEVNQERETSVENARLDIEVLDGNGNPVQGATI
jgi:protocatechuate 3,4-dioxygenase beta subunit